jgi:hypothetical protein
VSTTPIYARDLPERGCIFTIDLPRLAGAVTEYGRGRDQSTLARETARGNERLGFFTMNSGT